MYKELAVLAAFAFCYSLIANRLERTPITGPIVFITFGLVAGPLGLGWLQPNVSDQALRILADLTLALVLFIDAANADKSVLISTNALIPRRMLLLGLPGSIALGFFAGLLLFDQLSLYELAILATMLAATDAALGKGIVANKAVPARIREGLNVEGGLNDGLCVPVLLIFISLAEARGVATNTMSLALTFIVQEIGIGLIVGLGVTWVGAWLIKRSSVRCQSNSIWGQLPVVMLALTCFALAQSLHGSGYIAAFAGGILFDRLLKESTHSLVIPAEGMAETLAMLTWIAVGTAVIYQAFEYFSWQMILYALLSLTVVRMLPIFLSLTGTGEKVENKLFLGWFGPRGLASLVFAIIVLNTSLPGAEFMAIVVICTVSLSVFAHGLTANPLASVLAARMAQND